MGKGELTKESILKSAFDLASVLGLEALTIGKLADAAGLSKSGLFGHFQSKENLQVMVLEYSAQYYVDKVVRPALEKNRGVPRIRAIVDLWIKWTEVTVKGGCPILTAAIEFDDRPGVVQDKVQELLKAQTKFFEKAADLAREEGHFKKDLNSKQFAFEFYSLMVAFQIYSKLLKQKDAKRQFIQAVDDLIEKSSKTK